MSNNIKEDLFFFNKLINELIEDELANDDAVLAHKLCGAGNGGFFLLFKNKESKHEEPRGNLVTV